MKNVYKFLSLKKRYACFVLNVSRAYSLPCICHFGNGLSKWHSCDCRLILFFHIQFLSLHSAPFLVQMNNFHHWNLAESVSGYGFVFFHTSVEELILKDHLVRHFKLLVFVKSTWHRGRLWITKNFLHLQKPILGISFHPESFDICKILSWRISIAQQRYTYQPEKCGKGDSKQNSF